MGGPGSGRRKGGGISYSSSSKSRYGKSGKRSKSKKPITFGPNTAPLMKMKGMKKGQSFNDYLSRK